MKEYFKPAKSVKSWQRVRRIKCVHKSTDLLRIGGSYDSPQFIARVVQEMKNIVIVIAETEVSLLQKYAVVCPIRSFEINAKMHWITVQWSEER